MIDTSPRLVRRYVAPQRVIHWMGVGSFLALLLSGLVLLWSPLSFLAAGGWSRLLHRIAVVPFVALPIVYAVLLPREAKHLLMESLTYTRDDWRWLTRMPAYALGRPRGLPQQGRLNAGQKLHHMGTFLMFVTISASGFVLWFGSGRLGAQGLAITAMVHDLSMLGLSVLMIGHVYFTMLYDALSAMRTGYVTETYARLEHAKWLETLPADAFATAAPSSASDVAECDVSPPSGPRSSI